MNTRILDIIPESLRPKLFEEVKEELEKAEKADKSKKEDPDDKQIEADIKAWAKQNINSENK